MSHGVQRRNVCPLKEVANVATTTRDASGSDNSGGGRHGRGRSLPIARIGMINRHRRRPLPPEATLAATEPAEDAYAQLEKLGKLHEQGILTDEEFAAQKAKLLA